MTASIGTGTSSARPLTSRYAAARSSIGGQQVGVGRPLVRRAAGGVARGRRVRGMGIAHRVAVVVGVLHQRSRRQGARARGAGVEVLGRAERLTDERGPDHLAVALDERAVGLVGEQGLGDAGHGQRVEEAAEHGEHGHHAQGGDQLSSHHFTPRAEMTTSMTLMPTNGVMIPPTP